MGEQGLHISTKVVPCRVRVNRGRAFPMFMFYKMHSGEVAIHPTLYLTPWQYHTSHKYYIPHSRIDQQAFSFFPRTVRLWNKLPATTAQAPSLSAFQGGVIVNRIIFNSATYTCREVKLICLPSDNMGDRGHIKVIIFICYAIYTDNLWRHCVAMMQMWITAAKKKFLRNSYMPYGPVA